MAINRFPAKKLIITENSHTELILVGIYDHDERILLKKTPRGFLHLPARKVEKLMDPDKGSDQLDDEYEKLIEAFMKNTSMEVDIYSPISYYEIDGKLFKSFAIIVERPQIIDLEKYKLVFFPADPEKILKDRRVFHPDRQIILDYLAVRKKFWEKNPTFNCLKIQAVSS
ncbi:MAG: hypothetical protein WC460_06665 [Patescibacteria group bacterium]